MLYHFSFVMKWWSPLYFHTFFGKYILFKNSFIFFRIYYWVFSFVRPNPQPTSIISFRSTSIENILEDRQFIDVVFYYFNEFVVTAVGVRTTVVVSRSRLNQILSITFVFFNSLVFIWIQQCIHLSRIKYLYINLYMYLIVSFFSC